MNSSNKLSKKQHEQSRRRSKSELSEQQMGDLRLVFDMFDTDKSGTISPDELRNVMRALGQFPSDAELKEMIDASDKDGNNEIDFDEFCELMRHHLRNDFTEDDLLYAFRIFDRNDAGTISASELYEVMHDLGEAITREEAEMIIDHFDRDGDGEMDFREFRRLMRN